MPARATFIGLPRVRGHRRECATAPRTRAADPGAAERVRASSNLIVATVGGVPLQVATDSVDLDTTFAGLGEMVRDWRQTEADRRP